VSVGPTFQTGTVKRVPRWSSTGNVNARPDSQPPLHATSAALPKRIHRPARSKPIGQTTSHNHAIPKFSSVPPTDIATIKSP
jgi:hypothetical protein